MRQIALASTCLTFGIAVGIAGMMAGHIGETVIPVGVVTPVPIVHSVNWYEQNHAERVHRITWCNNNVGQAATDADCKNAMAANMHVQLNAVVGAMPR